VGLLSVVFLICATFYVREVMYECSADFRQEEVEESKILVSLP